MKRGSKILSVYASKPVTIRWGVASELGLVKEGETIEDSQLRDKLSFDFLIRAMDEGKIDELESLLGISKRKEQ